MSDNKEFQAFLVCVGSFLMWGLLALYWHQLSNVGAAEIVAHRAVWALLFTGLLVCFVKQWGQVFEALRNPKLLLALTFSSLTIALNWGLYVWSVTHDNIVQTSMGYYINPLMNIAASALIFKAHVTRIQILAIALASMGVINLIIGYGAVPWAAITLALSFCIYGVIRKKVVIDAIPGLFIETAIISIPGAIYIIYLTMTNQGVFALTDGKGVLISLLVIGGLVTTIPLAGFSYGARHLSLSTVGIIQYISPTVSFLIGVFVYKEVFTFSHLITFIFIWAGVVIYSINAFIHIKKYDKGQKI